MSSSEEGFGRSSGFPSEREMPGLPDVGEHGLSRWRINSCQQGKETMRKARRGRRRARTRSFESLSRGGFCRGTTRYDSGTRCKELEGQV
jgi:hypothetical protein